MQFVDQPHSCMLQRIMDNVILKVGHFTYGSLSGRDIKATCEGLKLVVQYKYLQGRVSQVQRMAAQLKKLGVPTLEPCGTSAVYLDIDRFFHDSVDKKHRGEFLGNSVVGLMLAGGIRGCELGVSAFYSPHGNAPYKDVREVSGNFLRLAIPRQLYSDADLNQAVLFIKFLYDNRDMIKPVVDRPNIR